MNYSPDLTLAAVKMVLSLAVILAILWAVHRWSRRSMTTGAGPAKGRWVKVLGNHYLGPKKSIAVVQVPGTVLVLGVGTDQVNLLTRIDDPEVLAQVAGQEEVSTGRSFREQLQRLTGKLHGRQDETIHEQDAE